MRAGPAINEHIAKGTKWRGVLLRSFDDVLHRSVAPQKFNTMLLAIFGGLALLLATTGIYGVLSYSMSRRTAEIGLRVAKLGNTSVQYELGVFKKGSSECAAEGRFVHVYVDRTTRRPVPVPADTRAVLQPLVRG